MAVTHFFLKTSVSKDDKGLYSLEGKGIFRITGEDTECLLDKNVYSYCIDADNNKLYYSGLGDERYMNMILAAVSQKAYMKVIMIQDIFI